MGTYRAYRMRGLGVPVRNDRHLDRILTAYLAHYNTARPHRGINLDVPTPPAGPTKVGTSPTAAGRIARVDILGGLITSTATQPDRHVHGTLRGSPPSTRGRVRAV
jgi:hypothetical protein